MLTRRRFGLGLTAALAACANPAPRTGTPAGPHQVLPQRFGDADPHPWEGRTPQRLPVHGIDVNRYQPGIDWRQARAAGVNFAFVKATEGGDGLNPEFEAQWRGSAAAGVRRGALHFYYFCTPPEVQARWFLRTVPRGAGDLPAVLNLEWNPFSPTCRLRPPAAEVRALAARFLDIVTAATGHRPIVYSTVDFFHENDLARLGAELWLRSVIAHPSDRYPGTPWSFWQYSGTGRVDGITGNVDLNAFAGSEAQWQGWLSRRSA
jgi:lysozyme